MIKNNVLDAKRLLDYLKINKPSHFFCVSTDKAANPVNVMGETQKKMMENVIMSYCKDLKITTAKDQCCFFKRIVIIWLFRKIASKTTNFLSIRCKTIFCVPEESGEICLITSILGNSGDIYFPKLNENQLVNFKTITEDFLNFKKFKYAKVKKRQKI